MQWSKKSQCAFHEKGEALAGSRPVESRSSGPGNHSRGVRSAITTSYRLKHPAILNSSAEGEGTWSLEVAWTCIMHGRLMDTCIVTAAVDWCYITDSELNDKSIHLRNCQICWKKLSQNNWRLTYKPNSDDQFCGRTYRPSRKYFWSDGGPPNIVGPGKLSTPLYKPWQEAGLAATLVG